MLVLPLIILVTASDTVNATDTANASATASANVSATATASVWTKQPLPHMLVLPRIVLAQLVFAFCRGTATTFDTVSATATAADSATVSATMTATASATASAPTKQQIVPHMLVLPWIMLPHLVFAFHRYRYRFQ